MANNLVITNNWKIVIEPNSHPTILRVANDIQNFLLVQHKLTLQIESAVELKWKRTNNRIMYSVKVPLDYKINIENKSSTEFVKLE